MRLNVTLSPQGRSLCLKRHTNNNKYSPNHPHTVDKSCSLLETSYRARQPVGHACGIKSTWIGRKADFREFYIPCTQMNNNMGCTEKMACLYILFIDILILELLCTYTEFYYVYCYSITSFITTTTYIIPTSTANQ